MLAELSAARAELAALRASLPMGVGHLAELQKLGEAIARTARQRVDPEHDLAEQVADEVARRVEGVWAPLLGLVPQILVSLADVKKE